MAGIERVAVLPVGSAPIGPGVEPVEICLSFLEIVERAKSHLQKQQRISLRALRREFELDDDVLDELLEELVDVQRVAVREERVLVWAGASAGPPSAPSSAAPSATTERDPRAYTPKHLADKILQSKSALEGERKQVTVLFADVKGSMELAEQLDPEEWHRDPRALLRDPDRGRAPLRGHRQPVHRRRHHGAVRRADRARGPRAARLLRGAAPARSSCAATPTSCASTPGVNFSFRLGLNSGEVVVGKIGDDLRMDYTAQGHTVGLAQRMEQLAPAGRHRAVAAHAEARRGLLRAARARAGRSQGRARASRRLRARGRRAATARASTPRARADCRASSAAATRWRRSNRRCARSLEGTGGSPPWSARRASARAASAPSSSSAAARAGSWSTRPTALRTARRFPYLPLLELLRNLFGITEQDGAARGAAEDRRASWRCSTTPSPTTARWCSTSSASATRRRPRSQLEPAVRQRRLFTFLRRLIQLRTEAEPIVLLIDDLHWIDPGSDLFVAQIVEAVSATRTLLLRELPARVPGRLDAQVVGAAAADGAARRGRAGGTGARLGGLESVGRRASRARRRALGRQSVLRRRDRAVAARDRPPRRHARRVRARDGDRRRRSSGDRAVAARGAHRPSRRAREAAAVHRGRDRQGVPAAAARSRWSSLRGERRRRGACARCSPPS